MNFLLQLALFSCEIPHTYCEYLRLNVFAFWNKVTEMENKYNLTEFKANIFVAYTIVLIPLRLIAGFSNLH